MGHGCNDTDPVKLKYWGGGDLSQCHFIYHRFGMDWAGIKSGPLWQQAGK
jgi:hypothetical protein